MSDPFEAREMELLCRDVSGLLPAQTFTTGEQLTDHCGEKESIRTIDVQIISVLLSKIWSARGPVPIGIFLHPTVADEREGKVAGVAPSLCSDLRLFSALECRCELNADYLAGTSSPKSAVTQKNTIVETHKAGPVRGACKDHGIPGRELDSNQLILDCDPADNPLDRSATPNLLYSWNA
ncbi:unnamed protein product, partial [Nesidiocoris tenuis]